MNKLILCLILLASFFGNTQEVFEIKSLGFSMLSPTNWDMIENEEILKNLNLYEFTEDQKSRLILSSASAIDLVTYTKYNPLEYEGIIPTIKVRSRKVTATSVSEFLDFVDASNTQASKTLTNFKYKSKPEIITLSNKQVIRFISTFSLLAKGQEYKIISCSYYILKEGYYLSINFIEEENKENNQEMFNQLINSIKLK